MEFKKIFTTKKKEIKIRETFRSVSRVMRIGRGYICSLFICNWICGGFKGPNKIVTTPYTNVSVNDIAVKKKIEKKITYIIYVGPRYTIQVRVFAHRTTVKLDWIHIFKRDSIRATCFSSFFFCLDGTRFTSVENVKTGLDLANTRLPFTTV